MSTYRGIRGTLVSTRTSNPDNPNLGDIWYRSDTGDVQLQVNVASFSTGGNMNTARSDLAGAGIQTSAMALAGYSSPGTRSEVENYDGSSWTEITELNSARNSLGAFGATNTAVIACGGRSPTTAATESWNGSSWTEVNDLNTARFAMNISGCGTQTSGLTSGGNGNVDNVEVWDGTNWTAAGAELNTARGQGAQSGQSSSSAMATGGSPGTPTNTEVWNGTSWTEVGEFNTGRYSQAQSGTPSGALIFGGESAPGSQITNTELYDGTSWAEQSDLTTARKDHGGGGHSANTASIAFAGKAPPTSFKNETEEWNIAATTQKATVS